MASCRKLTHLDFGRQPDVPVNFLLDYCPQLKLLSLYDTMTKLNTANNGDTWVYPSPHVKLHQSTLNKIMSDSNLFGCLTRKCPKLTHLTMISSICPSSTNFFRIHMFSSRLGQVKIDWLFAGRYSQIGKKITRVAISDRNQKTTELQCELSAFNANVSCWYEAGKWGISFYGYLFNLLIGYLSMKLSWFKTPWGKLLLLCYILINYRPSSPFLLSFCFLKKKYKFLSDNMNDFASEPSEGATSSLLAQKSQIERVSTIVCLVEISTRKFIQFTKILAFSTNFGPSYTFHTI